MTTQLYIEQLKLKDITNIRPCMLPNLYDDYDKIKANGYNLSSLDSIVCIHFKINDMKLT